MHLVHYIAYIGQWFKQSSQVRTYRTILNVTLSPGVILSKGGFRIYDVLSVEVGVSFAFTVYKQDIQLLYEEVYV